MADDKTDFTIDSRWDEMGVDDRGLYLTGLRDVQGTFSGSLTETYADLFGAGPVTLTLYGPDPHARWYRRWFYRIRERLTGTPYPTIALASGPAVFDVEGEPGDEGDFTIHGKFSADGVWTIDL